MGFHKILDWRPGRGKEVEKVVENAPIDYGNKIKTLQTWPKIN